MIIECDVLVVGAGPAGSVAALYSSKQGLNTVLIERNSRVGAHANTRIDEVTISKPSCFSNHPKTFSRSDSQNV